MKCLSVRQPWADLLVRGPKDVENRTWSTTHRGWILIHATKGKHPEEYAAARKKCHQLGCIEDLRGRSELPHGFIVGRVWLRAIRDAVSSPWHVPGQRGWYLDDWEYLKTPIEYSGQLQLYDVDPKKLEGAVFINPRTGQHTPYEKAASGDHDHRPPQRKSRARRGRQSQAAHADVHQARAVSAGHEAHRQSTERARVGADGNDVAHLSREPGADVRGSRPDERPVAWPRLAGRATASMKRYLSVLTLAAREELADQKGRTWPDLTDAEAAAWLQKLYQAEADVERMRGLLMGRYADPLGLADRPIVRAERRRTCRVTGEDALAYCISERLFGFEPESRN